MVMQGSMTVMEHVKLVIGNQLNLQNLRKEKKSKFTCRSRDLLENGNALMLMGLNSAQREFIQLSII